MDLAENFNKFWTILVNCFFRLLYHQFSFMYDWIAAIVSGGKWIEWVMESRNFIIGEPILEIGFGPGHLQQYYLQNRNQIFGLDESSFMCRLAKKRLQRKELNTQNSGLCRGIAQQLPYADHSFSTVVMTFPTQYALDEETIGECWRVLRSEGKIVILLAVRYGGNSLYKRWIRWLFGVTHQSPGNENLLALWIKHYEAKGFCASSQWYSHGEDRLLFILAEKKSTPFANG